MFVSQRECVCVGECSVSVWETGGRVVVVERNRLIAATYSMTA